MLRTAQRDDVQNLVRQLMQGDHAALSRLLTLASAGQVAPASPHALASLSQTATPVIALTGSGGVGKSTLLGALASHFAERGRRVGVLACDPTSPITGGALLGDRCRIAGTTASERVFIRSLATASGQQGIAQNIELMLDVMKAYGFDRIFVETVGAGQGDTAVRDVADYVVLVLQPQMGDDLQWEKAGILEISDVVVVNKSDLPGADQMVADVTGQQHPNAGKTVPVLKTSVARNEGIEELCRAIEAVTMPPRGLGMPNAATE
jgi:LAO/AO transport system ATPase